MKGFLSLGKDDSVVPEVESERVISIFNNRAADITTAWVERRNWTQEVAVEVKTD